MGLTSEQRKALKAAVSEARKKKPTISRALDLKPPQGTTKRRHGSLTPEQKKEYERTKKAKQRKAGAKNYKPIAEMTPEQQERQREKWRKASKRKALK